MSVTMAFQITTKDDGRFIIQRLYPDEPIANFYGEYLDLESASRLGIFILASSAYINQPSPPPKREYAKPKAKVKGGYVYFIKGQKTQKGFQYKIGLTRQEPEQRFKQIQSVVPFKIELLHSHWTQNPLQLEQDLFAQIPNHRINGEWFDLSTDIYNLLIGKLL